MWDINNMLNTPVYLRLCQLSDSAKPADNLIILLAIKSDDKTQENLYKSRSFQDLLAFQNA